MFDGRWAMGGCAKLRRGAGYMCAVRLLGAVYFMFRAWRGLGHRPSAIAPTAT